MSKWIGPTVKLTAWADTALDVWTFLNMTLEIDDYLI